MLTIESVQTRRQWREFRRIPWRVYQDDPLWVPAPDLAEKRLFDPARNPFFQHARMSCWLARRDGEAYGRVAAIIDDNHNRVHREAAGFFGFFEVEEDDEAAAGLLGAARDWLARQGMTVLRGPANPSMNYECGLLVDGFDRPPVVMMTYNPGYYAAFCERFGLVKARDLFAYEFDLLAPAPEAYRRVMALAEDSGLSFRSLDLRRQPEEVARIRAVYHQAWEHNWGFVPLTDQEWDYLAEEFRSLIEPELVIFAQQDDRLLGLLLALPDVNEVLRGLRTWHWPLTYLRLGLGLWRARTARVVLVGVLPEYIHLGVGAALYAHAYRQMRKLGYEALEFSWVLEDNALANRTCEAVGGRRYKTYRIYEMPINAS
jgi:GNAT superfamily N-acetyltransferase